MQSCVDCEMTCFCFIFQSSIFEMFRELFEAAVSEPPPQGLGHSPQSRSMYAIDLLLKWDKTSSGMCVCGGWGGECMQFVKAVKKTNSSSLQLHGEPLHAWPVVHDPLYFLSIAPKQTLSPAFLPDCMRACVRMCACQKCTVQYAFCPYLRHKALSPAFYTKLYKVWYWVRIEFGTYVLCNTHPDNARVRTS